MFLTIGRMFAASSGRLAGAGMLMLLSVLVTSIFWHPPAAGEQSLSEASQNPIGSLISLQFENNSNFGVGPEDAANMR